jgi:hypothetical protein
MDGLPSLSAWDAVLAALEIVVPLAAATIGAQLDAGFATLTRGQFTRKYSFLTLVMLLVGVFADAIPGVDLVILAIWSALVANWAVARLRDMGISGKYRAVWTGVPIVGFFYSLYLMLSKGSPATPETSSARVS